MKAMTRVSWSAAPPFRKYEHSTGESTSDTSSDTSSEMAMASASGANILPSMPCSVISGRNTSTMIRMPKTVGVATSVVACTMVRSCAARSPGPSWPRRWNTFSTTTTVASTISPMAMASPPSDIRLAEMPQRFMTMKVASGVMTSVATTIRLDRTSPRNRNSTSTTSTTPSTSTRPTVHSAASTRSVRS